MKQRLTYLDIRSVVNELQVLNNSYIQQIYTPSAHIFILKTSSKHLLLVEPGSRLHFTDSYTSEITFFTPKIRVLKHNTIKSITQVGFDRVVRIETNKYVVYLEFFAGGNIIITENNVIKEIYRPVKELNVCKGETYVVNEVELGFTYERWKALGLKEMIGGDKSVIDEVLREIKEQNKILRDKDVDAIEKYGQMNAARMQDMQREAKEDAKKTSLEDSTNCISSRMQEMQREAKEYAKKTSLEDSTNCISSRMQDKQREAKEDAKKASLDNISQNEVRKIKETDKKATNNEAEKAGLDNKKRITGHTKEECANKATHKEDAVILIPDDNTDFVRFCDGYFSQLLDKFRQIQNYGILLYRNGKANNFFPYKIKCDKNYKEFPTFNDALREYFTKKTEEVLKKSDQVKDRQEKRILELEDTINLVDVKVELMHEKKEIIEKICKAHKNVIDYNLDWSNFEKYKREESLLRDYIIKSDFTKKTVLIRLKEELNPNENRFFDVELYFMQNFNFNVNLIYSNKKKMKDKLEKTKSSIKLVVKKLENKESKKKVKKEKITRKIFWYEKFNYFFTTNKKLVISGKNAQQNDILVKKYLTKNDLYFHAEIQGASSVILLDGNKMGEQNENDIEEAGLMALCLNNAWKSKVAVKVYYVEADQVSKTTESGEHVKTGGFIIKGKKNYVNVFRLEYGIGILFKVSKDQEDVTDDENEVQCSEAGCEVKPETGNDNAFGDVENGDVRVDSAPTKGVTDRSSSVAARGVTDGGSSVAARSSTDRVDSVSARGVTEGGSTVAARGVNAKVDPANAKSVNAKVDSETIKDVNAKVDIEKASSINACNTHGIESSNLCDVCVISNSVDACKTESTNSVNACNKLINDLVLEEKKYNKIDIQALKNDAIFNFTFDPKQSEKLEFGILVCAPWKIIKNYKYNEKLLPGNEKKGKVTVEIFKKFNKQSYSQPEMNCVKNISIDEYTSVLINNCKIGKK